MIDVINAKYIKDYTVFLTFSDGQSGELDLSYLINDKGVFSKFKDISFFKDFRICSELGTITWRDEIDIAPESLYSKVSGILPDWAEA